MDTLNEIEGDRSLLPKDLLIYYGYPSSISGKTDTLTNSLPYFEPYSTIVLSELLANQDHANHKFTRKLIAHQRMAHAEFYGYVDTVWPISDITRKIEQWRRMGASGIFLDKYGFDYKNHKTGEWNTREKHNAILYYIHASKTKSGESMKVFMNAWNQKDVFETVDGLRSLVRPSDTILYESFPVKKGGHITTEEWNRRVSEINKYRGLSEIAAIPTTFTEAETANGTTVGYDKELFDYSYIACATLDFDLFGWGEDHYGSKGGNPWRPRPKPNKMPQSQASQKDVMSVNGTEYTRELPGQYYTSVDIETKEVKYRVRE